DPTSPNRLAGAGAMSFWKAEQLLELATFAAARHAGVSLEEVTERFSVSKRRRSQRAFSPSKTRFLWPTVLPGARLPVSCLLFFHFEMQEALISGSTNMKGRRDGAHAFAPIGPGQRPLSQIL